MFATWLFTFKTVSNSFFSRDCFPILSLMLCLRIIISIDFGIIDQWSQRFIYILLTHIHEIKHDVNNGGIVLTDAWRKLTISSFLNAWTMEVIFCHHKSLNSVR